MGLRSWKGSRCYQSFTSSSRDSPWEQRAAASRPPAHPPSSLPSSFAPTVLNSLPSKAIFAFQPFSNTSPTSNPRWQPTRSSRRPPALQDGLEHHSSKRESRADPKQDEVPGDTGQVVVSKSSADILAKANQHLDVLWKQPPTLSQEASSAKPSKLPFLDSAKCLCRFPLTQMVFCL